MMQERTKIQISSVAIEAIKEQSSDKELIMFHELLANKSKIEDLIISYHFKSRGRVYDLKIEIPVIQAGLSGFFNVKYAVGHFNACADVDTSEEEKMLIQFDLDLDSQEANLVGEFIPERGPDEF